MSMRCSLSWLPCTHGARGVFRRVLCFRGRFVLGSALFSGVLCFRVALGVAWRNAKEYTGKRTSADCGHLYEYPVQNHREGRQQPKSKRMILDTAMSFLEPFTTRSNLQRRLNEQFTNANKQERAQAASTGGDSDEGGVRVAVQPAPVAT